MKIFKKDWPIWVIALFIFLVISSVYFYPVFKGYGLYQGDRLTWQGMSKEVFDFEHKYHKKTLWTNSMFGGMPAYQIRMTNANLLVQLEILLFKIIPSPIIYIFLLMAGFYILTYSLGIKFWPSVIGSVAFGLASFNVLYLAAGHASKIHTLAFLAPTLGGMIYAYRKDYLKGAAMTAVFASLFIAAGHIQIIYYSLFLIGLVIFEEFIRLKFRQFLKVSIFLVIAGLLAIMSNAQTLLTLKDYTKHTTRGQSELTLNPETLHRLIRYQRAYIRDKEKLNQIIEHQIDSLRNEKETFYCQRTDWAINK